MRKNNIALYIRAIVFGFILWTSNLSASVVTYTLTDVTTVDDGTLVSGYVVIDTELGQYDTISITADADPILGSPSETFYANPDLPITTKKDPQRWAEVQADLATLASMPTSTEPEPYPSYGEDTTDDNFGAKR